MASIDHNPLAPMDDASLQKVRERAYHLWEADGCPDDRSEEYWERAETLTRMESGAHSGELPNPATLPGADPLRTQPIEEAALQENLGEFPDRLSDQGERQATPSRQHKKAV